jgi:hypothetical protein
LIYSRTLGLHPFAYSLSPIHAHAWNYSRGGNQYKCMTWLKMSGYYSLHGNGCNLLTEIVVYDD